jgi:hypothetical protein
MKLSILIAFFKYLENKCYFLSGGAMGVLFLVCAAGTNAIVASGLGATVMSNTRRLHHTLALP